MQNSLPTLITTVVIPYYQKQSGLLSKSLNSIFKQSVSISIEVIIVDDGSPYPAQKELDNISDLPLDKITLIKQKNGGAGAARNAALNAISNNTKYVAFLDSDDSWRINHLETAINALEIGYDAYFSDWWSFNFPDSTNFERIQTITPENHKKLERVENVYELEITPIEHILSDGGGVIQTSTVVYNFQKYPDLRFREEFFNGQDFFFWMDLGKLGAQFVFSTDIGCENGEGINIYQGSGWGTEHSLRRIRNELFVWVSTEKFYTLPKHLKKRNRQTIRNLQDSFARDILHRVAHLKPINMSQLFDIIKMTPTSIGFLIYTPFKVVFQALLKK